MDNTAKPKLGAQPTNSLIFIYANVQYTQVTQTCDNFRDRFV